MNDLELIQTQDPNAKSVFGGIFSPSNPHTEQVLKDMIETYTIDVSYLRDTQDLLSKYTENPFNAILYDEMIQCVNCIKSPKFMDKYGFIEYTHFSFLNNYEWVLLALALYTIVSPALTIATPLIIIIVPFIILNFGIQPIDFKSYMGILKTMGKSHPVVGLIMNFGSLNNEQRMYQLMTLGLYLFSIYRQCMDCYTFVQNIIELNNRMIKLREYVSDTIQSMRHFSSFTYQLKTYETFNQSISQNINDLIRINNMLDNIVPFSWCMKSAVNMGVMLKSAYTIYTDLDIQSNLEYAINFNSYIEIFEKIHKLHKEGKITSSKFRKQRIPKLKMIKMVYPSHIHSDKAVSNNVSLDKNMIITGPNASGKTTMLKSVLLNVLFTQQYGMGFYQSATLTPFKYLHCYLNIPDTNGRDSLFQAEARRCKLILDSIQSNIDGKHLCVFDELYSGTNPEEAVTSSSKFLQYITKKPNVKWMLTTHFIDLCTKLDKVPSISNYHMKVTEDFKYLYKLKPSISRMKGAYKILEDMKFPKEMIGI
jgi:energy-coupling factor transporter ATP-binding protein EcfA2